MGLLMKVFLLLVISRTALWRGERRIISEYAIKGRLYHTVLLRELTHAHNSGVQLRGEPEQYWLGRIRVKSASITEALPPSFFACIFLVYPRG